MATLSSWNSAVTHSLVLRVMYQYAPVNEQPKLGRLPEEMSPEERAIYDYFSNSDFIEKLFKFMSLEGQKGKDKFHSKYFTLFKVPHVKLASVAPCRDLMPALPPLYALPKCCYIYIYICCYIYIYISPVCIYNCCN